ncbi:chromate resistance protein ChrB domain-containing protein [Variovorax ginsengisoli]|uniref:Chromate resistance protein n=1 Tax=Variovorax ginsengisoli TaxID=363844 RepID=A0ABT8S1A2_9BURK|nr:chromate resistance protein ChrB domain-containing protein [Variovorax ginsengisoli]MDN8611971.1 chromate resistance protein [Variovorax ginsengisoli]MDO1531141.1 chromate resistance protein [Variovorax ginsengisoli]
MEFGTPLWLLLIISLPTTSATARMRVWRGLKALGCVALRDGAHLLPARPELEQALQALGDECLREGGTAWLMAVQARSTEEATTYRGLFDRREEYAVLRKGWQETQRGLASMGAPELARLQRKLQREFDAARAIDFFPGEASIEAEAAWTVVNGRIESLLSPDEPHETEGRIPRLDAAEYQGRLWATRRRLWVDRVASAWLIRRFIDQDARFQWLAKPSDCPKRALGFDFDDATFTHVGDRVTFETLLASFDLEGDPALVRLGAIVHALDIGGDPVPEAKGFEAVMSGARERLADDDALLVEMSTVLDSLYAHFQREAQRNDDKPEAR